MTEQEYADIAAACDRLLRAPSTGVARLAIPALHFLNEHPSSLAQYAPLLSERSTERFPIVPKAVIRAARGITRSLGTPRQIVPHHESSFDVVIVSHLLKLEQLQRADDFYFGALQSQLRDRGATSLVVLVDHSNRDVRTVPPGEFPRLILPGTASPATEASIWRQCAGTYRALRREAARSSNSTERRLALLASRQAVSASATNNLRMHSAVARVCQAVNPRIVITTYEGTVAERLIWHAARTAQRRPLCVGYQHALVLERAHAIRRLVAAPGLDCDPDVILTLGEITHAALARSPRLQPCDSSNMDRIGAPLSPICLHHNIAPRRCLVLPDADARECETLFDFALACARHRPDIKFTFASPSNGRHAGSPAPSTGTTEVTGECIALGRQAAGAGIRAGALLPLSRFVRGNARGTRRPQALLPHAARRVTVRLPIRARPVARDGDDTR